MPEDVWHREHYHQMSLPLNHWPESHTMAMGGMHDTDLSMFQAETGDYEAPVHRAGLLMSPHIGYMPDASWGSDMEMGTPSTTSGFPSEAMDGYQIMLHASHPNQHLEFAPTHERVSSSAHSPGSPYDSPRQHHIRNPVITIKEQRPALLRSITAPATTQRQHRSTVLAIGNPSAKRSGSEDEDDEYIPSGDTKARGRKRQRIPHTAVERRYRENLNAHLDKLRQTVPSLAPKRAGGVSTPGISTGEGVKPSKCEILNGAIEHISTLDKENSALKMEVEALRSRLEDMERWCGAPVRDYT